MKLQSSSFLRYLQSSFAASIKFLYSIWAAGISVIRPNHSSSANPMKPILKFSIVYILYGSALAKGFCVNLS